MAESFFVRIGFGGRVVVVAVVLAALAAVGWWYDPVLVLVIAGLVALALLQMALVKWARRRRARKHGLSLLPGLPDFQGSPVAARRKGRSSTFVRTSPAGRLYVYEQSYEESRGEDHSKTAYRSGLVWEDGVTRPVLEIERTRATGGAIPFPEDMEFWKRFAVSGIEEDARAFLDGTRRRAILENVDAGVLRVENGSLSWDRPGGLPFLEFSFGRLLARADRLRDALS